MNKKLATDQNGRSMIEMLGVLAIVGVLSVAGIAGYSKAMGKYKINKVMDQVSTIAANVKTMFASQGSYTDLAKGTGEGATATGTAISLGLLPEEMTKNSTTYGINGLNGKAFVGKTKDDLAFFVIMDGLSKDACVALATSDWGGASGFRYLAISQTAIATEPAASTVESSKTASGTGIIRPVDNATTIFSTASNADSGCSEGSAITWVFY